MALAVPEWASFFSPESFARFRAAVETELHARGLPYRYCDDGRYAADGGKPSIKIHTLARECHSADPDAWSEHIGGAIDAIERMRAEHETVLAVSADLERARPLLRVKLWPGDVVQAAASGELNAIVEPFAPGLAIGLSLQFPSAVSSVSREDVEGWPIDAAAAFEIALANTRNVGLLQTEDLPIDGGGVVRAIFDGPYFLASHLLFLSDYVTESRPYGAIAAAPHSGAIVFHEIADYDQLRRAVGQVIAFARRAYGKAPRPISPHLYWWRPEGLMLLPYEVDDDGALAMHFPAAFTESVIEPLRSVASA